MQLLQTSNDIREAVKEVKGGVAEVKDGIGDLKDGIVELRSYTLTAAILSAKLSNPDLRDDQITDNLI